MSDKDKRAGLGARSGRGQGVYPACRAFSASGSTVTNLTSEFNNDHFQASVYAVSKGPWQFYGPQTARAFWSKIHPFSDRTTATYTQPCPIFSVFHRDNDAVCQSTGAGVRWIGGTIKPINS